MKYGKLTEVPPKPKGKFQNPVNFVLGGRKWGMENATFDIWMNILGKTRNTVCKEL